MNKGPGPSSSRERAAEFNRSCFCLTLDRSAMSDAIREAVEDPAFFDAHIANRPNLFSNVPVFLPKADRADMLEIIRAIERTVRVPQIRDIVLEWAPPDSRRDFGPVGAFMGYDFHLASGEPPRLIEINTNAGGAFLNTFGARAQSACCDSVQPFLTKEPDAFEENVVHMFENEWRRQRGTGRPNRIAIVDDKPETQFLYPEFVLAQRLFRAHGMDAVICDAAALVFHGDKLSIDGQRVDLVYNRLVDFDLSDARHAALGQAYRQNSVVVTPNPHNHALLANKRNLTILSDADQLASLGLPETDLAPLAWLPRAVIVRPNNAASLWADRKSLFFKPAAGHGSKAVYRGDKLTRSTWQDILASDYIAQRVAPPGERSVVIDGEPQTRKVDVRLYTYDGALLLAAARLYQGQTTNFRTEGGGFAPVHFL